jgi:hypothetical protein
MGAPGGITATDIETQLQFLLEFICGCLIGAD